MTSRIGGYVGGGNWKYEHGTAHYGRNFSVIWLKLCELSFIKTRHLRNPYNENLPVKISRDCQELEPSIGEQLASLLYLEPDSELMAIAVAAETKREEEKAKGVKPDDRAQNPDIVPYEDNEEEEEEESEEEEGSANTLNSGQGRGRGSGVMWPPQMPLVPGGRPIPPGVRGFPPVMMGADGFGYGGMTPDLYGVAPRAFGPYGPMGPRFPGNFSGLNLPPMDAAGTGPGMMFRGRPSPPVPGFPPGGPGMMMGGGRVPFMGGIGMVGPNPAQANRAMGPPPFRPPMPPAHSADHMARRDQKSSGSDRNERFTPDSDRDKRQEMVAPGDTVGDDMKYSQSSNAHHTDAFGGGGSLRNEESESEDEAPRRSRHGEGKKKRRGSEGEAASDHM